MLTLFRIILIPFFVLVFYLPVTWSPFVAAPIFCVAAVADWFDGFLACHWNQSARSDAFLGPVVDKVLVAIAIVLVTEYYHSWWVTSPAATMVIREIIIPALREWMAELDRHSNVAVSWIGEVKVTAQMVALAWLLWRPNIWVKYAGIALLSVVAILILWSMSQHLGTARADLLDQWSFRYNFQQMIKSGEKYH